MNFKLASNDTVPEIRSPEVQAARATARGREKLCAINIYQVSEREKERRSNNHSHCGTQFIPSRNKLKLWSRRVRTKQYPWCVHFFAPGLVVNTIARYVVTQDLRRHNLLWALDISVERDGEISPRYHTTSHLSTPFLKPPKELILVKHKTTRKESNEERIQWSLKQWWRCGTYV